jgi:hypothetical protein
MYKCISSRITNAFFLGIATRSKGFPKHTAGALTSSLDFIWQRISFSRGDNDGGWLRHVNEPCITIFLPNTDLMLRWIQEKVSFPLSIYLHLNAIP